VRRLFSTFAHGAPGAALLLLRIAAGLVLVLEGRTALRHVPSFEHAVLCAFAAGVGILLLVGLWTPIAGLLLALAALWYALTQPGEPYARLLLGTLGVALTLLGPGGWSVDARLFGWKRVELPNRKS
jgi:putative oxidoreductase